jgi:glycosyltransferase involved in cell wall biosynthesis
MRKRETDLYGDSSDTFVAFVSTYPPRRCGIGTFTADLTRAMIDRLGDPERVFVLALHNDPMPYDYPPAVKYVIDQNNLLSYRDAADYLNISKASVVNIQHEYGIFGGDDGEYVLTLARNLKKPLVTTLHTVSLEPSPREKEIARELADLSDAVVVMAQRAVDILSEKYGVAKEKCRVIPHGVPDVDIGDPERAKTKFHLENHTVISTFGLISPGKGIEHVIDALPEVVDKHPEVVYVIFGATHPEVKKLQGEEYRLMLQRRVRDRGLEQHVVFHNRFATKQELIEFLQATDIYVTPYPNRNQIVSGTLAYALATGKAIVSTRYLYAEEVLSEGRGILVNFSDTKGIANALKRLLDNPQLLKELQQKAYELGRTMVWPEVARRYLALYRDVEEEFEVSPRRAEIRKRILPSRAIPRITLKHLGLLTDGTGVIQHGFFTVPNRHTGYTTDDNARALLVAVMHHRQFEEERSLRMAAHYLSFLHFAQRQDGNFHNFLNYNREWLDEVGSEDAFGRAVWALGYTYAVAPSRGLKQASESLLLRALPHAKNLEALRAKAYTLLGLAHVVLSGTRTPPYSETAVHLADALVDTYQNHRKDDWEWFEEGLYYDNAKMPQALFIAFRAFGDKRYKEVAKKTLTFLTETLDKGTYFSLVGNRGWHRYGQEPAEFDEQPIDAASLVEAYAEAYRATRDSHYLGLLEKAVGWFLGRNSVGVPLYDFTTGGCYDGLEKNGVNYNQGAESTISFLLAVLTYSEILSVAPDFRSELMTKAA